MGRALLAKVADVLIRMYWIALAGAVLSVYLMSASSSIGLDGGDVSVSLCLMGAIPFGGVAAIGFLARSTRFDRRPRVALATTLAVLLFWQITFGAYLAYETYRVLRCIAGRAGRCRAVPLPRAVARVSMASPAGRAGYALFVARHFGTGA
jgi:hypothetical protein